MDHVNVCMFHSCFVMISLLSLAESFSVKMAPAAGLQHNADVFFAGTRLDLHCSVGSVDIGDTNVTIYLNDNLIFEGKEQSKVINEIQLSLSGGNLVTLQLADLTSEHCGEYTCRVESNGVVEEDSFFLNVASDSPQCIAECDTSEQIRQCRPICYSQLLKPEEYFTWEKVNQDGSFTNAPNFTPRNLATKAISTLSDVIMEDSVPVTYKCSIQTLSTLLSPVEKFCLFNFSQAARLSTGDPREICEGYIADSNPTQPGDNYPKPTTTVTDPSSFANTRTSVTKKIHSSFPTIFFIGIPCIVLVAIITVFVCLMWKRNSQKHSDCSVTTTAGTEAHRADYKTIRSVVGSPLDQNIRHDKRNIPSTDGYTEYKENGTNIYHEIEKEENPVITLESDYQEPSKMSAMPYGITDLNFAENERCASDSSFRTANPTRPFELGSSTVGHEVGSLNHTPGEINNVVYEGYEEYKTSEPPPYAVIDAKGHKVDNLNRTSGEIDNVSYEGFKESKPSETPTYAVLDPEEGNT